MPKGAPKRCALVAFLKNHILLQPYAVYPNLASRVGKENKGQIVFSANQRLEEMLSLLMPIATVFYFKFAACRPSFFTLFGKIIKKFLLFRLYFFCFFHVLKNKFFGRGS